MSYGAIRTIDTPVPSYDYEHGNRLTVDGAVWFIIGIERLDAESTRLTLRWAYDTA